MSYYKIILPAYMLGMIVGVFIGKGGLIALLSLIIGAIILANFHTLYIERKYLIKEKR